MHEYRFSQSARPEDGMMNEDRSNDSPIKTCDVPIIPLPGIEKIRARLKEDFEEIFSQKPAGQGRRLLPEEK